MQAVVAASCATSYVKNGKPRLVSECLDSFIGGMRRQSRGLYDPFPYRPFSLLGAGLGMNVQCRSISLVPPASSG